MRRSLFALTAAAASLLPATAAQAADGDIIVQREPGLDSNERRELRADAGVKLVAELGDRAHRARRAQGRRRRRGAGRAARGRRRRLRRAGPPHARASAAPTTLSWRSLWGLDDAIDADIDAPEAWQRSLGAGVTVAVVDTGINADHEDLAGQIAGNPGETARQRRRRRRQRLRRRRGGLGLRLRATTSRRTAHGHGTHVAGTIAATGDNGIGVIGVAPEAKVLPLRALDDDGSGCDERHRRRLRLRRRPRRADRQRLARRRLHAPRSRTRSPRTRTRSTSSPPATTANDDDVRPTVVSVRAAARQRRLRRRDRQATTRARDFSNYGATTRRPVRARRRHPLDLERRHRRLRLHERHVDGDAARRRRRRARARRQRRPRRRGSSSGRCMSSVDAKPALAGLSVTGGRLNADAAVAAITGGCRPTPTPTPAPTPRRADAASDARPRRSRPRRPRRRPRRPGRHAGADRHAGHLPLRRHRRRLAATKRSKLRVRFSLTKAATVRFSIARRGTKKPSRAGPAGPRRRQQRHDHAPPADRADAQARLLHARRRPQRDRDELAVDPRPIARRSDFGSGSGDRWFAAAPANARGSSLSARSRSSRRSAGVSRRARRASSAIRRRSAASAPQVPAREQRELDDGDDLEERRCRISEHDRATRQLTRRRSARRSLGRVMPASLALLPEAAVALDRARRDPRGEPADGDDVPARSRRVGDRRRSSPVPRGCGRRSSGVAPGRARAAGAARGPARRRRAVRARRQRPRARRRPAVPAARGRPPAAEHARRGVRPDAARDGAVQHRRRVRARERARCARCSGAPPTS